jgi:regulator of protease activity HflC (stomatin/prohibitin superfamily)
MDAASALAIVLVILAGIAIFVAVVSFRVVAQWERMVVKRWGQTNQGLVRDPGLRFLIPIVDQGIKVDLREQFIEVPRQTAITKDNAPLSVDFLIYWKIVDPLKIGRAHV